MVCFLTLSVESVRQHPGPALGILEGGVTEVLTCVTVTDC